MAESNAGLSTEELRAFEENPYNPDNKKPEDIIRLFYSHDVPIIPVISKRGLLLGVIRKEDAIAELSDIERVSKLKIDKFVTKIARKMSFDELLVYGKIREFIIINIFGEVQGKWNRLQLFTACETNEKVKNVNGEIEKQKEEQVLEWMIYLILEHIPRALYALNEKGKTIFFNSYFEDIYTKKMHSDVDTRFVEKTIKNAEKNELFSGKNDTEIYFYNKDLEIYYEKVPFVSKGKKVGFLIYCDEKYEKSTGLTFPGIDARAKSLADMLTSIERQLIVNAIKDAGNDLVKAAKSLKISKPALQSRVKKFNINIKQAKTPNI
ncbi:MAG: hypothetical protein GY754_26310 [bacterium]|nr:hypothetical protein [bacterium]